MLAKLTVKNQLTLPKAVATRFSGVEYFDVSTDGTSITILPLRPSRADEIRQPDRGAGCFVAAAVISNRNDRPSKPAATAYMNEQGYCGRDEGKQNDDAKMEKHQQAGREGAEEIQPE